jgi:precorrin-3B synthase
MTPTRRGACPGIATPMGTGDGLLARMQPEAPVAIEHFIALCQESQARGNGVMEVTQRGSLQVRGLSESGAVRFAAAVGAFGLRDRPGPAVLTTPLMGVEPGIFDLRESVLHLREALAAERTFAKLSSKTSIVVDGGERLHLDQVSAVIRVRAQNSTTIHLSIAGTAATATLLGEVAIQDMERSILAILAQIAARDDGARVQDFFTDEARARLLATLPIVVRPLPAAVARPIAPGIGVHSLIDGSKAVGIALPFGFTEAASLIRLAQAARDLGANSIRPAPDRTLLLVGLPSNATQDASAFAANMGFITQASDSRRHIVACAGAPACASSLLDTRHLASEIAAAAAPFLDGSFLIHLSGCAKGCAHPKAAALTLVGPSHLVVDGRAGDRPNETLPTSDLASAMVKACSARQPARTRA